MPAIADLLADTKVMVKYHGRNGEMINEIIDISRDDYSKIKYGIPFKIKDRGLIGLVEMPGETDGFWAVRSMEEFNRLYDKAEQIRAQIAERQRMQQIIEEEELAFHKHKARIEKITYDPNEPVVKPRVYYSAMETNRSRH